MRDILSTPTSWSQSFYFFRGLLEGLNYVAAQWRLLRSQCTRGVVEDVLMYPGRGRRQDKMRQRSRWYRDDEWRWIGIDRLDHPYTHSMCVSKSFSSGLRTHCFPCAIVARSIISWPALFHQPPVKNNNQKKEKAIWSSIKLVIRVPSQYVNSLETSI